MSKYRPDFAIEGGSSNSKGRPALFVNNVPVVQWNVWDVVKAVALIVGLFLVFIFVFVIAEIIAASATTEETQRAFENILDFLTDYAVIHGIILASVWFFSIRKHGASWRELGFRRCTPTHLFLLVPLVFALSWGFEAAYTWLVSLVGTEALIPEQEYIEELFDEAPFKPLLYFDIVVVTPIVEEILFRGFILAGLTLALGNIKGLLISSVMFALVHIDLDVMPIIFVSGMLAAWLYMRTGSLWPPIAMHAVNNAAATVQYEFFS